MSSPPPKKRKGLSVEEKLKIIKKYDNERQVKQQKDIAAEVGIAPSTLRTILQNREKLSDASGCSRQRLKSAKYEDLEKILVEWFHQARSSNLPISGPILQEKAFEVAARLGLDEFSASTG